MVSSKNPSPFLSFLFTAADFTVVLVLSTQSFCTTKTPQTMGDRGILLHIHRQVEEIFVFTTDLYSVKQITHPVGKQTDL